MSRTRLQWQLNQVCNGSCKTTLWGPAGLGVHIRELAVTGIKLSADVHTSDRQTSQKRRVHERPTSREADSKVRDLDGTRTVRARVPPATGPAGAPNRGRLPDSRPAIGMDINLVPADAIVTGNTGNRIMDVNTKDGPASLSIVPVDTAGLTLVPQPDGWSPHLRRRDGSAFRRQWAGGSEHAPHRPARRPAPRTGSVRAPRRHLCGHAARGTAPQALRS